MTAFGNKVYGAPVVLINHDTLALCIKGVKKKITRELNAKNRSVDPEFIEKKKDNVHRLRIIRDELNKLNKQLNS